MPTLFQVTNCFGDVRYMGPKGEEWSHEEATVERFLCREDEEPEELERRVKWWSARNDVFSHGHKTERYEE